MKLIFFGAQGVGKGTLAQMLSEKYGIPTLSTGQVLREAIAAGTELGKIAEKSINDGILVPPEVAAGIVNEAVVTDKFKDGYILDGFPRNLKQTELFEEMDQIDAVVVLTAPYELSIKRLTGRRTCNNCGAIFNIDPDCAPHPEKDGICDKCTGELIQRDDDTPDAIQQRLDIYHKETEPILEKYGDKVVPIDATSTPEGNFQRILDALKEKGLTFE